MGCSITHLMISQTQGQSFGSCSCPTARHRYLCTPTSAFCFVRYSGKTIHAPVPVILISVCDCFLNMHFKFERAEQFACVLPFPGPVRPTSVHPPAGSRYLLCEPMPSVLARHFCPVPPETPSLISK